MITRKLTTSMLCLSLVSTSLMAASDVTIYRADGTPLPEQSVPVVGIQPVEASYERIFWNKVPIPITLKTGTERLIHFPDVVRFKPPVDLTSEELKVTGVGNVVYLQALKDFKSSRMQFQTFNHDTDNFEGGSYYFLDVSATSQGATEQIVLIDKAQQQTNNLSVQPSALTNGEHPMSRALTLPSISKVDLVRFASQQLYAPERLIPSHPGIFRTPLRVKSLTAFYRGGELTSTPLASWKGGDKYVTAVKIQNHTPVSLALDPRLFRGQWRARTLQHPSLGPHHSEQDTTTVYLISDRPFHESLWF